MSTRAEAATKIIRESERTAFAWGILPFPLIDAAAVTLVQLGMIRRLAGLYGLTYRDREVRPILTALLGSILPVQFGVSLARSLIKGVPGVGFLLGVLTLPTSLGGSTRLVGKLFAQHFENGGNVADFDLRVSTGRTPVDDADVDERAPATDVDDLTRLEGIGPKINELLDRAGIRTYQQLAETPVEELAGVLEEAGSLFRLHRPDSWPRQARLAAEGGWDELDELNQS